jgi:alkanesulfonate monooxygenase SsuD/methylene tetrahydromethanopterin reductase-like flavin-dependent oxidoreductase (luciferase family)
MRTGVVLPTFRDTPDDAFEVAGLALAAGVDGLFCYDHVWPMGQTDRPALAPFPMLGSLAAAIAPHPNGSSGPFFGTLVARVGLVPNDVLLAQFTALEHIAPGRIIAGLGTGDILSAAENLAYGIPYAPANERRADMVALASDLKRQGTAVWLAGGAAGRTIESRAAGVGLNVWDVEPEVVVGKRQEMDGLEVTWAGPPPTADDVLRQKVAALARAGASWVIFGWPFNPDVLVEATHVANSSGEPRSGP